MAGTVRLPRQAEEEIPDKLYFRIGEVSRLAGVQPYVLRYWEREFPAIAPRQSGRGHRLYRRRDVELILEIKRLLYEKRFTIEGARKTLAGRNKEAAARKRAPTAQKGLFTNGEPDLSPIKKGLLEILEILR
ncbi:MAG: MerR family transcriptional regulator [Acidobacteria bacterium]|nr:MerR family transcriptional regulator [Acidobacteriota bacterium]